MNAFAWHRIDHSAARPSGWSRRPTARAAGIMAFGMVFLAAIGQSAPPSGGAACQACRGGRCQHGHAARPGHHDGCREGRCVPYCPVRPQEFGFYGTQWRKWPGQGVVPVSDEQAATPAVPPRLVVPGPNEESSRSGIEDELTPDEEAAAADAGLPPASGQMPAAGSPPPRAAEEPAAPAPTPVPPTPERAAPKPEPVVPETDQPEAVVPEPEPMKPEPTTPELTKPEPPPAMTEPKAEDPPADDFESLFRNLPIRPAEPPKPAVPPQPAEPPKPAVPAKPEDENLFEAGPARRVPRKFIAGGSVRGGVDPETGDIRPAAHATPADPRAVPRVPFDPAAESRRLRSER